MIVKIIERLYLAEKFPKTTNHTYTWLERNENKINVSDNRPGTHSGARTPRRSTSDCN